LAYSPLTLTPSLKGRGKLVVFSLVVCCVLLGAAAAQAETWKCKQADGSVVFSDRNLSGQCVPWEDTPPLMRVPAVPPPGGTPPEEARPEAKVDYVKWTK
jgi:hypothetical protein